MTAAFWLLWRCRGDNQMGSSISVVRCAVNLFSCMHTQVMTGLGTSQRVRSGASPAHVGWRRLPEWRLGSPSMSTWLAPHFW